MSPRILLTGATGFIGGDLLYQLNQSHPDWNITCMVRNEEKGATVTKHFPNVRIVYGDNTSAAVLESEAANADLVIHTSASDDDVPSAQAISRGLTRSGGFWIHTSGGLILARESFANNAFGEKFEKVYDDWDNVGELTSMVDDAPHRNVDKIVLAAASDKVKVAIVAPAVVYGQGRGPDKQRSFGLWAAILQHQKVFVINQGENIWHQVHVQDLSRLYLLLAEAAVNGGELASWNQTGYYLAENGSFVFGEALKSAAQIGYDKGFLPSSEVEHLTPDEADQVAPCLCRVIGTTSRGVGKRAKILLGWKPEMPGFVDSIADGMAQESRELGR